ncbi:3-oxoacyl-ACP reductase family protein [Candidatus Viridilinea mediisalina]|uniref:3-oxoacyl-ACP reductase n=1 Tax=Candidatus Viridilinea mediisalina TaxID=2024553 RepID=A0A2A6RK07_9CHLR|nr:3-oxoacyl-ACP reductase family protein [Candidatus Viridilinea mediisalina]PDW03444.1 3-oxoacyl-ACP reductase [Candidatus Viridilinea mediisalina]
MGKLDGQIAIVTGAGRGIGRAIAIALAAEGAKVAVNYNSSATAADEVVAQINADAGEERAFAIKANVSDAEQARSLINTVHERWGRLDIMVNNAGITRDRSIRKMNDTDWLDVIQTNLNAVFFCTTAAMQHMTNQKHGRIINISSMNGQTSAFGQANYGASKGGIIAFTKTVALELARFGITVNVVAPGFTMTDMFAKVPEKVQDDIKSRIPLGRFARPEEIAKAVVFLAADADYITGAQINVNGGAYM